MGAGQQGNARLIAAAKMKCHPGRVDEVLDLAYQSMIDRDWPALRPLLHPYLHWTGIDDVTIRGRTNVLAMLTERPNPPERPTLVEMRDNQVYRWHE